MKILVTGGCGFIGYALSKRLLEEGNQVDIIDNLYIGKEAKIVDGAKFLGGDVRAMVNIEDKGYDYIYHLAAFSRVELSYQYKDLTFSVNVDGTKQILDYALRNNSKVIFVSSSSIHHSISPYSSSKRIGEELCNFYRNGLGLDVTIVRLYNVYGPGELVDSHMAAVIGKWRRNIRDGKEIEINLFGHSHRAFTHIEDVIDGLIKLHKTELKNLSGWEMGNIITYSINDLYKMFEERFGDLKIKYTDFTNGNYRLGTRKDNDIERLDWYPKDRLKEYIKNL
jgi:nucleoside-diphosphate-sugar epimerase